MAKRKRRIVKRVHPANPDYKDLKDVANNKGMTTQEYVEYLYTINYRRKAIQKDRESRK